MDTVLEKREKEFLSAYQSHMIEVQKELLDLKRKANEKELKLQQDDKILSLEQELAWIREETMKAREEIDNQDVLVTDLKQVKEELHDDSKFLKDQLKECKVNNTKLKIGLSKSHNKYENLLNEAKNQNKTLPIEMIKKDQINLGISCKNFINLSSNF
jgi:chromosome segregation ATPase